MMDRACQRCGEPLQRRMKGGPYESQRMETFKELEARKYCSTLCANPILRGARGTSERQVYARDDLHYKADSSCGTCIEFKKDGQGFICNNSNLKDHFNRPKYQDTPACRAYMK